MIMKSYTIGIDPSGHHWDKLAEGGFKKCELVVMASVRETGKSVLDSIIREYSLQWLLDTRPEPKPLYKFSRAKWWEAEFSETDYLEVRKWCIEQFGPEPWPQDAWSRWYHKYHNRIFFRDHQDYVLFLLRWS
jgi:hypothetical protein